MGTPRERGRQPKELPIWGRHRSQGIRGLACAVLKPDGRNRAELSQAETPQTGVGSPQQRWGKEKGQNGVKQETWHFCTL